MKQCPVCETFKPSNRFGFYGGAGSKLKLSLCGDCNSAHYNHAGCKCDMYCVCYKPDCCGECTGNCGCVTRDGEGFLLRHERFCKYMCSICRMREGEAFDGKQLTKPCRRCGDLLSLSAFYYPPSPRFRRLFTNPKFHVSDRCDECRIAESQQRERDEAERWWVYFWRDPHAARIKIGKSTNVDSTLKQFRRSVPDLEPLGKTKAFTEQQVHSQFKHLRKWHPHELFVETPELIAFINTHCELLGGTLTA